MKLDYLKEYSLMYKVKAQPEIITALPQQAIMIEGSGAPSSKAYQEAVETLYSLSYTIKMSPRKGIETKDFMDYKVFPLEGFWWQEHHNKELIKDDFSWISFICQPDFVTQALFEWAVFECQKKKPHLDFSKVKMGQLNEGLCVQMLHVGSYDSEPMTIQKMQDYILSEGYQLDINAQRHHHEIYLSDPNKTDLSKLKTIIRLPIKK